MNNDEKILKTIEDLKLGQTRIEKRLDNTATKQDIAQLHTIVEAVRAGQEEQQQIAAKETTVVTGFSKLTNRINDLSERVEELEKEAGIPHPHKH